jgi:hypothetical protein
METRHRGTLRLAVLARLLREAGGGQSLEWAIGAGVAVGFATLAAGGLQGSFDALSARIHASLGAREADAARPAGTEAERHRVAEETEHYRELLEEAEEAAEQAREEADGGFFGSLFGGPLIGTAIGEAIGAESAAENDAGSRADDEAAILAPAEPAFGGAREDDDD